MVYDWDSGKEETCYRMYIEEKRSLEEIMEYFKNQNFTPRYGPTTDTLAVKDAVGFARSHPATTNDNMEYTFFANILKQESFPNSVQAMGELYNVIGFSIGTDDVR